MKAIIPAAGFGTRLRPLTYARPKPVLPVANKPIICHAVQNLAAAGIREIAIIVSSVTRKAIEGAVSDLEGVQIAYIEQPEMLGLGDAVRWARDWVGESDFCVYLGDNLFEHGVTSFLDAFRSRPVDAVLALVEVPDARAFGVAVLDDQDRITQLFEKPKCPPSNLAVAGVYCFKASLFGILEALPPSARGEYEITDAIQRLIEDGGQVIGQRVVGWWKDTGRPLDLIETNRLLLERLEPCVLGEVTGSRLAGRVVVEPGAEVHGSVIMGPVTIASGARIENAYLGPFTSVGRGSVIRNAEVEYSVIDEEAEICDVNVRLQECLIGLRARIVGHGEVPKVHRLILSDTSVLEFGC
ncbi:MULTISPECIES: glucose-1-phosphate thymidylyltransferase [Deinococcus]|uniref:Glucose-1-phosphate thymidyltransferase n=1 Tax=Deinococcus geothermalis (strain DSM 11300 / CIP 105573 / AG-3a) TaxID=319795 RepID=Q1J358_DEIGD|nr:MULTISPECIES: glucose-1-phosphate thymidylyltransferase [Deinococcus]ABF44076.1 glucose-1-phosphate thymidyltransferase [Deinococcus geothermalis DSM 11300]MBI0447149.1 glucose-1-phosphate thymidylyltransferase [Deinococcus sp. DB0503]